MSKDKKKVFQPLSEEDWKKQLSPLEYQVMRKKGTERPFSGEYNDYSEEGRYTCKGCGVSLFDNNMKFPSSCGWPSFDSEFGEAKIKKINDTSHGMQRTEIVCSHCESHLGHLFDDGPTQTGMRYCVNSASIHFRKKETP